MNFQRYEQSMSMYWAFARKCSVLAIVLLVGCASTANQRDPLEPLNRAVYGFNDGFDRVIAKPVAEGYRSMVPDILRLGVSNFFSNLDDLWVAINNLLQGKPQVAADDFGRVVINSSVGLFGLIDVASDIGLEKHNEDFGQTMGRWGVGSGPYLVLPFLGPSTMRDGLGLALVDVHADFVSKTGHVPTRNSLYVTRAVSIRSSLLDATRLVEEAALDKYSFTRDTYLQRRQNLVYDGSPPRENRSDAQSFEVSAGAKSGITDAIQSEKDSEGNSQIANDEDAGQQRLPHSATLASH